MPFAVVVACISLLMGLLPATSHGQGLPILNYSSDDGLPQSVVLAAAQDHWGYLWLATSHGVSRYDGSNFENYARRDGVPDLVVRSLFKDRAGGLWLLTDAGIARRRGETFEAIESEPPGRLDGARCMVQDDAGHLWVGLYGGGIERLHEIDGTWQVDPSWSHGSALPHLQIRAAWHDAAGRLWFGTDGAGLVRWTGQESSPWEVYGPAQGLTDPSVRRLAEDPSGRLLVGTKSGLFGMRNGSFVALWPEILGPEVITALQSDPDGGLWVGTRDRGVCYAPPGQEPRSDDQPHCFGRNRGLAADSVTDLLRDIEGNLWITTYGGGISRWGRHDFENFGPAQGLPYGGVEALLKIDGALWLGSQSSGVARLELPAPGQDLRPPRRWNTAEGLPHHKILALAESPGREIWIGTLEGAARWDGYSWQTLTSLGGRDLGVVLDVLHDGSRLVFATTHGLHAVRGDPFGNPNHRHYGTDEGLPSRRVNRLRLDRDGTIWIGTNDGVAWLHGDRLESLPSTSTQRHRDRAEGYVADLLPLPDGDLWLCTAAGLRRYENNRPQTFEHAEALSQDACQALALDGQSRLWLGTHHGIHLLDGTRHLTWTVDDGLISGAVQPAASWVDVEGRVWFGTARGTVRFRPDAGQVLRTPHPSPSPPLRLQSVDLDGQRWPLEELAPDDSGLLFSTHRHRDVRFQLSAVSLSHADQVVLRYRLKPLDEAWRTQKDGAIVFASLPSGSYRLEAQANHLGTWSEPLTISFRLLPPWWATPWSRLLFALLALGLAYAAYRLRLRLLERRQEELELQVAQRTAEVQWEQSQVQRKNEQLEINHLIVQQINAELDFSNLLQSILEGICFVVAADRAFALVWDQEQGHYVQRASHGGERPVEDAPGLSLETIRDALLTDGRSLSPSLFVSRTPIPLPEAYAPLPQSYVVMTIELDDMAAGYLVVGRRREERELSQGAHEALEELQDHVVSAFVKGRMLDELRRLNNKKNEFLGIAAHDLRSPLGSVMSCAELLLRFLDEDRVEKVLWRKFLGNMRLTSRQMLSLVNELLDVASIETGRVELQLQEACLVELLEERRGLLEQVAVDKDITLHLDLDPSEAPLVMDRLRMAEVVDNLLTNALKYTPPGGHVRVFFQLAGDELITHVEDNGQGLPKDELPFVFSGRKLSARPTGGESSHGLGLVIVKKVVELHGGRIWLESTLGEGSTFSFALPRLGVN